MKEANTNFNEWMHENVQARTGVPFQYDTYSCVPLLSENKEQSIIAFLLSKDNELLLVQADTQLPEHGDVWSEVRNAYLKKGVDLSESPAALPSETWFG